MIVFDQVQKSYQVAGRAIPALHATSMTIETGEVFGIVGHSGAGKSTLVRLINMLEPATGGRILIDNEDITRYSAAELRAFRRKVGMIFQHFGRTEAFKIYNVEEGKVTASAVVPTLGSGHGALAGFLLAQGVSALICGGIGGGAQQALAQAGIRLYGGVTGSADAAVDALLKGTLLFDPAVHCDHHGHEHGEGHTCGHHGEGHTCGGHH